MYILQKNKLLTYENGTIIMSKNTNKRTNNSNNETNQSKEKEPLFSKKISDGLLNGFLGALIVAAFSAITLGSSIQNLKELTTEKIDSVNSSIDAVNKRIDDLNPNIQLSINTLNERLENIERKLDITEYIKLTSDASKEMSVTTYSISMTEFLTQPTWDANEIIATDESGESLTASELINKKILFGYKQDNQEIVFYGQYDSESKWDGNCLLNVYANNKLIMVNDVVFDHGNILSYNQIFADFLHGNNDEKVWIVSQRVCDGNINFGDSYVYKMIADIKKDFSLESVNESNLYYFDSFNKTLIETQSPISFYHGNTSDGKYNDTTGQAYLVKFADNGTVKYLYQGMFKEGYPNDDTGNAWDIAKEEDTDYMYYFGTFNDGKKPDSRNEKNFRNNLTVDEINEILKEHDFNNCAIELNWQE